MSARRVTDKREDDEPQQQATPQAAQADSWPTALAEERALLGVLILDPAQLPRVTELEPELFSLEAHKLIRRALVDLAAEGCTALDVLEVTNALQRRGALQLAGGTDYLCSLTEGVVPERNFDRRVRRLRELASRRKLALLAVGLAERATDSTLPVPELIKWTKEQVEGAENV